MSETSYVSVLSSWTIRQYSTHYPETTVIATTNLDHVIILSVIVSRVSFMLPNICNLLLCYLFIMQLIHKPIHVTKFRTLLGLCSCYQRLTTHFTEVVKKKKNLPQLKPCILRSQENEGSKYRTGSIISKCLGSNLGSRRGFW